MEKYLLLDMYGEYMCSECGEPFGNRREIDELYSRKQFNKHKSNCAGFTARMNRVPLD